MGAAFKDNVRRTLAVCDISASRRLFHNNGHTPCVAVKGQLVYAPVSHSFGIVVHSPLCRRNEESGFGRVSRSGALSAVALGDVGVGAQHSTAEKLL